MTETQSQTTRYPLALILFATILLATAPSYSNAQSAKRTFKFDFGTGKLAPGYTRVVATTKYNQQIGYGFDYGSKPIAINRGGNDPLRSDFCTSNAPFFFSVNVPQGNYNVTVILGDQKGPTVTTIKAESRRLMVKKVATKPGRFIKKKFTICVWHREIKSGGEVILKDRELSKLDWDHKLTIEFNNSHPCVDAIEITPADNVPTVFLAGNSTVTDQQLEPWSCWGQMLPRFFKPGTVAIADMAASGSTLKASVARKRLEKIANMIKPGDYFFIQFADNDQKPGPDHVDPFTSYEQYLKRFINVARSHGATAVLVTPINRHFFNSDGKIRNTLGNYPAAMRQLAKKDHVALIDLNVMSKTMFDAYGPKTSGKLFVQFPAGTFPGVTKELKDNTHFNDFGAYELAKCIVKGIRNSNIGLVKDLKDGIPVFNPAHPDPINQWFLPMTPMYTSVKPYGS